MLAVIAFHLQFRFALGGFTGVDVFFVISGFLITSIILADMDAGRFSMREFYVRRIRRIYPALVAVLLGTAALAFLFCLPIELTDFAKSMIAASLSASNLYFGAHSGYFEPLTLFRPAIQTWSLGVEDQFYLLFPPTLVLLRRWMPARLTLALGLLAAASFAASAVGAFRSPELAFFMPWTRACELLLGALLATGAVPRARSRLLRGMAAGFGLLFVLASFLLINGRVPFPGFAALLPCGGAALLIWSGQGPGRGSEWKRASAGDAPLPPPTSVARLLGTRPLVFIGLISYSLYLWHWPLVVFQGISFWGDGLPHRVIKATLFLLSLVLAVLSWRFVERPFRDGAFRLRGAGAFRFAAVSSGALVLLGVGALALHGLPGRFPPAAIAVGSFVDQKVNYRVGTCMVIRARDFRPDPCLKEDPSRPNWLLIGDSHAGAQWQGLVRAYPGVHFLQLSGASCRPDPAMTAGDCGMLMQMAFKDFLPKHHVDRIVAVGRWVSTDIATIDRLAAWTGARGIPLTVIGPTQDYEEPLPRLLAYSIMRRDPGLPDRRRTAATAELDTALAAHAREQWHVPYISLVHMFCDETGCQDYVDARHSIPLLVDEDHFTNEGSVLAGERIAAAHLFPVPGQAGL